MCGPQFCAMQITEDVRPTPPNMASPRRKRCKGVWKKRPASLPRRAPSFTRKFEGCALRPACRIGRPRPLRRNSKMGVTEAEAGGGPVDSKGVLPNDPASFENEASRRHDPGRPASLPFLGGRPSSFWPPAPSRLRPASRRFHHLQLPVHLPPPRKGVQPRPRRPQPRLGRLRHLCAGQHARQRRANGVQGGPYLRTVRRPTRAFCSSFIVGRQ